MGPVEIGAVHVQLPSLMHPNHGSRLVREGKC